MYNYSLTHECETDKMSKNINFPNLMKYTLMKFVCPF